MARLPKSPTNTPTAAAKAGVPAAVEAAPQLPTVAPNDERDLRSVPFEDLSFNPAYNMRISDALAKDPEGYIAKMLEDDGPSGQEFRDLRESIRVRGLINPVTVAEVDGDLCVVAGARRSLACKSLGQLIVVEVRTGINPVDAFATSFSENKDRQDITPEQRLRAVEHMVEVSGGQRAAAGRLGMSEATVSQAMSMRKRVPESVLTMDGISWPKACELAKVGAAIGDDEERDKILEKLAHKHSSSTFKELREDVNKILGKQEKAKTEPPAPPDEKFGFIFSATKAHEFIELAADNSQLDDPEIAHDDFATFCATYGIDISDAATYFAVLQSIASEVLSYLVGRKGDSGALIPLKYLPDPSGGGQEKSLLALYRDLAAEEDEKNKAEEKAAKAREKESKAAEREKAKAAAKQAASIAGDESAPVKRGANLKGKKKENAAAGATVV